MIDHEPVNVDALEPDECKELAQAYLELSNYCTHIARAKEKRAAGFIKDALLLESIAEKSYKRLPMWARW